MRSPYFISWPESGRPTLTTERIVLRSFRQGDEADLVGNADSRAVSRGLRDVFPHPYTFDDAVAWITL